MSLNRKDSDNTEIALDIGESLMELVECIYHHVWTPEERRAHCISFAYGNVAMHNPAITKEMVEAEYDKLHPAAIIKSGE